MARSVRVAPSSVVSELRRGLRWVREGHGGDGLKPQTIREARDLVNGYAMSQDKAVRMRAWLARHAVDRKGEGFRQDEEGYPSPGRVAWALWGGDPAVAWSDEVVRSYMEEGKMEKKRVYTGEQRREMAMAGYAMPDGSFPIADEADLRAAMRSIGRAKEPSLVRAHIRRRARQLGLMDLLTDAFKKGEDGGYYGDWGMIPWSVANDPPDLPIPCTPADLTPAMQASMPVEMQSEFCARWNALASPVPEGAGMSDEAAFHCALSLCREYGGWLTRPDGSWFRVEVSGDEWAYEEVEVEEGGMAKVGRVLSASNRAKLEAAYAALASVLEENKPAPTEAVAGEVSEVALTTEKVSPIGEIQVGILKSEIRDEQVCYGYAYVATDSDGNPVTDHSGDVVDVASLRKAVMDSHGKVGMKIMHKGQAAARIVGSMWADHAMLKAIGADPKDAHQNGWLIMVKVDDTDLWSQIKSGKVRAFSIGGKGKRIPVGA